MQDIQHLHHGQTITSLHKYDEYLPPPHSQEFWPPPILVHKIYPPEENEFWTTPLGHTGNTPPDIIITLKPSPQETLHSGGSSYSSMGSMEPPFGWI